MNKKLGLLLIILLIPVIALAEKSDLEIQEALFSEESTNVVVVLEEPVTTDNWLLYALKIRPKTPETLAEEKELIKDTQEDILDDLQEDEFDVDHQYATVNAFSGEVTMKGLNELENDPRVKKVSVDRELHAFLDVSAGIINAPDVHGMQISGVNITGAGETVCVIDTGINYSRPGLGGCTQSEFLAGNCSTVLAGKNYCVNEACSQTSNDPVDNHGHGTHVSGIIISSNDTYKGIAPDAKIVSIKALNSSGLGSFSDVLAGVDWCVNNATLYNISVISMSLGTSTVYNDPESECNSTDSLVAAIDNAVANNITVIAASGNQNQATGIAYPACAANATSVAGTNDADGMYGNSNTDEILDLLAPGQSITSIHLSGFQTLSGTSMAAPHVAAAVTLLNQYERLESNTTLTPTQIKAALNSTGVNVTDPDNGLTFPRINVLAAVSSIDNTVPRITINVPQNDTSYANSSLRLNISINEPADWCGYSLDEAANVTMGNTSNRDFNYSLSTTAGSHNISFSCNDTAGNYNTSNLVFFTIDATAPPGIFNLNESSTTENSIYWNWTNPGGDFNYTQLWITGSNVANVSVSYYNATSLTAGTNYTLSTRTVDDFGNVNTSWVNDTAATAADSTAPVITLNSPANGSSFLPGELINFTITDSTALSRVWYNTGGSNTTLTSPYDINTSSWSKSNVSLTIWANDTLGYSSTAGYNFTVNNSAPSFTNLVNQTVVQNQTLNYQINATDQDSDSITYYDNTTMFDINSSTGVINWTATQALGNYSVLITAGDGTINTSQAVIFSVTTKPDFVPDNVTYGELHNGTNELNLTINNSEAGSGSALIYVYVNGTLGGNATHSIASGSNSVYSVNASLIYGTYNLTFAVDPLDSVNETNETNNNYTVSVTVGQTPPFITAISPTSGLNTTTNVTVNFTVIDYDNDLNYSAVTYFIGNSSGNYTKNGTAGSTILPNVTLTSFYDTFASSNFADGSYTFYLTAQDDAARQRNYSASMTIDNTDPVATLTIEDTSINTGDDINVSCSVTDATSGVRNVTITDDTSTWCTANSNSCEDIDDWNSAATYNITCMAYDNAGNSDTATGTVAVTAVSSSSSSSSSSEGGGRNGGTTTTTTTDKVSKIFAEMNPDTSTKISIDATTLAVSEVAIDVNSKVTMGSIVIESLTAKPSGLVDPNGIKYQYFKIDASKNIDDNLKKATIKFRVKKSWISSNSIDANTILLKHYTDAWRPLGVVKKSEDSTYIYYEAPTGSFSYFAITASKKAGATSAKTTTTSNESTVEADENVTASEVTGKSVSFSDFFSGSFKGSINNALSSNILGIKVWMWGIITIMLVMSGFFLLITTRTRKISFDFLSRGKSDKPEEGPLSGKYVKIKLPSDFHHIKGLLDYTDEYDVKVKKMPKKSKFLP